MDKKFKVFVIAGFLVLFVAMVAGGFFIIKSMSNKEAPTQVEGTQKHPKDLQIFQLSGDVTTNLISEKDESSKHVIKVTVGFSVDKKSKDLKGVTNDFVEKEILIRDEIIQVLRDQSYEDMASSEAQKILSDLILSRVSELLFTQSIEDVYFGDFFVQ